MHEQDYRVVKRDIASRAALKQPGLKALRVAYKKLG